MTAAALDVVDLAVERRRAKRARKSAAAALDAFCEVAGAEEDRVLKCLAEHGPDSPKCVATADDLDHIVGGFDDLGATLRAGAALMREALSRG